MARGGKRRLPASFEAAREARERAREPPHPYQQLRLQGQCWGLDLRECVRRLIPVSKTSHNLFAGPGVE